jgi:hypothetical protein
VQSNAWYPAWRPPLDPELTFLTGLVGGPRRRKTDYEVPCDRAVRPASPQGPRALGAMRQEGARGRVDRSRTSLAAEDPTTLSRMKFATDNLELVHTVRPLSSVHSDYVKTIRTKLRSRGALNLTT